MKTTNYKLKITGLLMVAFLMMAGYSQSQSNCVPDSLTATNVTAHSASLAWAGIHGPTHVRFYPTGTTDYVILNTHMNHIRLHNLTPNTPYSWDLSNLCNGVWTEYTGDGSFTTLTDTVPPPTCIPTDLTATNVTFHSADLSWGGIQGRTWVRYAPTGDTIYRYAFAHHGNEISLHRLASGTTYSWDLNNFCNGQWTGYQGNGSFTTLTDTVPPPTCIPTDLTATNVTFHSADLSWGGIHGRTRVRYAPTGDTIYRYAFAHHGNEISLHRLASGTTYSWDLNNFCNGQWTGYQGNGSFTTLTDTVPPPTCIPTDLTATNVTFHSADLSWGGIHGRTRVRYAPTGDTIYRYAFAHHGNEISLHRLASGTTYSWDLNNFCNGQWTGYQGNGSFTTLTDTVPPPTCIPTDLEANNITGNSADLTWGGITGMTHVRYYATGTTDYMFRGTHTNMITIDSLQSNTAYSWDLSNFCNGEWTPYTGNGSFTTLSQMYITGIGTPDGKSTINLSVYPNPVKEKATVTFTSGGDGTYMYKIVDIAGREMTSSTRKATSGTNTFELNLAGNPKGIYFLHFQKGSETKHIKLIKQ